MKVKLGNALMLAGLLIGLTAYTLPAMAEDANTDQVMRASTDETNASADNAQENNATDEDNDDAADTNDAADDAVSADNATGDDDY